MELTKEGAQSLRMKMRNAELHLKEATVIYGFHPLAARLPEHAGSPSSKYVVYATACVYRELYGKITDRI